MATKIIRVMPASKHLGTVIFLHGSGDTGPGIKQWAEDVLGKDLSFPHLKILYPTAPLRPYTPLNGEKSYVWFDREEIAPDVPEHLDTINSTMEELSQMIQNEVTDGISLKNIIIGGFSMGGAMAMHLGYRKFNNLGGVFALSSFLNDDSIVYKEISENHSKSQPPLFMCHGDKDRMVALQWGQKTFELLKKNGVQGQFHVLNNTLHELKKEELLMLKEWILHTIPLPN